MQHFNINLSRRSLLKAATFGAITTALPPLLTSTVAAQEPRTFSNAVFYHFPFPGLGHVRPRNGGGYRWEPIVWQFGSA